MDTPASTWMDFKSSQRKAMMAALKETVVRATNKWVSIQYKRSALDANKVEDPRQQVYMEGILCDMKKKAEFELLEVIKLVDHYTSRLLFFEAADTLGLTKEKIEAILSEVPVPLASDGAWHTSRTTSESKYFKKQTALLTGRELEHDEPPPFSANSEEAAEYMHLIHRL